MDTSLLIEDDCLTTIKGAKRVVSATQSQGIVETASATIVLSGSNLEVKRLDLDNCEVCFSGKITNVKFNALGLGKQPILKRMFK